jgi:hypothetical protein
MILTNIMEHKLIQEWLVKKMQQKEDVHYQVYISLIMAVGN